MENESKRFLYSPNQFDMKKARTLGLSNEYGDLTENYYQIQEGYRKLLEEYLEKALNISSYDQIFSTSELNFKQVSAEEKDIYQKNSRFNYLYLRNTLYIEQLSKEELSYLIEKLQSNNFTLDNQAINFINNTLTKVINSNPTDPNLMINYGPIAQEYFSPSMSIVLGFRYNPYEDESDPNYDDDKWFDNNMAQTQYIVQILNKMKNDLNGKLPLPISIIQYDDVSVTLEKKNNVPKLN